MKSVALFSLCFLFVTPLLARAEEANAHAERIARAQNRVGVNLRSLAEEARKLHNHDWQVMALQILDRPRFTVIAGRKSEEKAIVQALQADGLWDEKNGTPASGGLLFPTNDPMPFIASAGGPWTVHHAYPGGLVYHTLFNLKSGLSYAKNYQAVYGVRPDLDLIRASAIWHDSAKTMTLPWKDDGSVPDGEQTIANTAAHHIFAVAEALYRKLPAKFVVVLASAHEAPAPAASRTKLIGFLKAGARIAGVPFEAAGLTADGKDLAIAPIEAFIHHFDDGDYDLTIASCQSAARTLDAQLKQTDFWLRDERMAANGDIALYPSK